MKPQYREYMMEQLKRLLKIDSTTGFYREIETYLAKEISRMGYEPELMNKGGVIAHAGGYGSGLVVMAHADDIGLMARYVNADGSIRVAPVGGLLPIYCDNVNVRLYTRCGKSYTGTMRRHNGCTHRMMEGERLDTPDYDKNLFLYLDEDVATAEQVRALGIRCGDFIAPSPDLIITDSGYIKSRFIDDKALVAVLLAYLKYIKEEGVSLSRSVTAHFSMYEEIGHGGSCGVSQSDSEVLALDVACCGPFGYSDEKKVSICAKDASFPYHYDMVTRLAQAAQDAGADYEIDMYLPRYGSDANAALRAGFDVRHGLIGPGVTASHGYERTHINGLVNTFKLLCAYAR